MFRLKVYVNAFEGLTRWFAACLLLRIFWGGVMGWNAVSLSHGILLRC